MVASWMASTEAFLFDFDGTLARLNIDFQALRLEVLAMAQEFGIKGSLLPDPPYLLELADAFSAELAVRDPGQAAVFRDRSLALIEAGEWEAASPENLFPYTRRVLAGLLQENYQIAILTRNSGASVRRVFPEIDRYCHLFLPREAVTRPKPDPGHLLEALHRFQVPARKAVMVGDHPLDILSGKKAGTRTVGVLTGRTGAAELEAAQADIVLSDAAELLGFL